jgi:hypothetical protein
VRCFFPFESRQELAVAFSLQFLDWDETNSGGVDAIKHSAETGTVIEDVIEMSITLASRTSVRSTPMLLCDFSTTFSSAIRCEESVVLAP